ncbi:MAG TPA: ATP-binding protein, partial [Blastocatellia bacterium]|nr:ATP-binding protein [Blastocatellia bacterium]
MPDLNETDGPVSERGEWPELKGLLVTVIILVLIQVMFRAGFYVQNPAPLYLLAVVFAVASGGLRSGFISAALVLGHALYFFSTPGRLFNYTNHNLWHLVLLAVAVPIVTLIVGSLKQRREAKQAPQGLLSRGQSPRAGAEAAHRRSAFLAETSQVLSGSLDYETTLKTLARLAVPEFADYCIVELIEDDKTMRQVAVAHIDQTQEDALREFRRRYPFDPNLPYGSARVLRTGEPDVVFDVNRHWLETSARSPENFDDMLGIGINSYMCLPLRARGRLLGVISLAMSVSGRHYQPEDLSFAEEMASRAALAVDNARLYREAREANHTKDEFLATVSHELRTPINAILGWTQILLSREKDPVARRALEIVERNAKTQAQLIEDILDASRVITGRFSLEIRPVDLASIIEAAVETVRPTARAHGVDLQTKFDSSDYTMNGDANRLQQVILNLLTNALKFTPGGGTVEVALRPSDSADGRQAQLVISDTGEGISAEFLPHVFDRFSQADSTTTRRHGGLGLGLAITRHLVELHGGTITAQSAGKGQGATFTVNLPLSQDKSDDARATVAQGSYALAQSQTAEGHDSQGNNAGEPVANGDPDSATGDGEPSRLKGLSILLVDDDADTLEMLSVVLERAGAEVVTARSAREALGSF